MASVIFFHRPLNTKALEKLVQDQNRNRFWRPQWWKRSTPQNNSNNNININSTNNSNNAINENNFNNNNSNNNLSNINNTILNNENNNNDSNSSDRIELMLYDMLSSPEIRPTRNETQQVVMSSPELSPLPVKTTMSEPAHDEYNDYNSSSVDHEHQEQKIEEDNQKYHYIKTLRLTSDQLVIIIYFI